jgi:hypothetical protein
MPNATDLAMTGAAARVAPPHRPAQPALSTALADFIERVVVLPYLSA